MLEIFDFPVIDDHCHAFLPEKEDEAFDQLFNLSTLSIPKIHTENMILYRKVVRELAGVLHCPFDFDKVLSKRKEMYTSNPNKYIRKLFDDAVIDTLIVDTGYPTKEFTGYSVPLGEFKDLVGCKVEALYRLEPLIFNLFEDSLSFDDILERYLESINDAIKKDNYIGLKSVIAYGYGLNIKKEDEEDVKKVYDELKKNKILNKPLPEKKAGEIKKERKLRNFLIWKGIEKSIELDVPFQIHTGVGDSPWIDVRNSNPLHLFDVISDEELRKAKIIIVHAGYPFVEETGFLVNNYPNVYVDLSEMIPFIGTGIKNKILDLLEMAPTTKILYGSDGYNVPELFWISALMGKKAISEALSELVKSKAIDEDYAYKTAEMILSKNSRRLYRI